MKFFEELTPSIKRTMRSSGHLLLAIMGLGLAGCGAGQVAEPSRVQSDQKTITDVVVEGRLEKVPEFTLDQFTAIVEKVQANNPTVDMHDTKFQELLTNELKGILPVTRSQYISYEKYGLNSKEQELIRNNPWHALTTKSASEESIRATKEYYPPEDRFQNRADAFRHSYWNVCLARYCKNRDWAERWTTAHEDGEKDASDKAMDMHNNAVGRKVDSDNWWRTIGTVKEKLRDYPSTRVANASTQCFDLNRVITLR